MTSVRPYLVRALIDWITDNDHTPYLGIDCGVAGVEAPAERTRDGRLVLNVSAQATRNFVVGNDWLDVDCRFSGRSVHIRAPVGAVVAVYSRESGHGMAFEPEAAGDAGGEDSTPEPPRPRSGGPKLRLVE